MDIRLGLGQRKDKKEARSVRVAGAGQGNIETVHEPKPIQAAVLLWGQGRRAMKDHHGPQTQVAEGAYAIKVSMRCSVVLASLIYPTVGRTDHLLNAKWICDDVDKASYEHGYIVEESKIVLSCSTG